MDSVHPLKYRLGQFVYGVGAAGAGASLFSYFGHSTDTIYDLVSLFSFGGSVLFGTLGIFISDASTRERLLESRDDGYDEGYDDGRQRGFKHGLEEGLERRDRYIVNESGCKIVH